MTYYAGTLCEVLISRSKGRGCFHFFLLIEAHVRPLAQSASDVQWRRTFVPKGNPIQEPKFMGKLFLHNKDRTFQISRENVLWNALFVIEINDKIRAKNFFGHSVKANCHWEFSRENILASCESAFIATIVAFPFLLTLVFSREGRVRGGLCVF